MDAVRAGRRGALYVVCDGVSSTPEGNWAARTACERLATFFEPDLDPRLENLLQLISEIDWELRGKGQGRAACTLAVLWLAGGTATVLQVGDSQVLRVRHGDVASVTDTRRGAKLLRNYLGMGPHVSEVIRIWQEHLFEGDLFFLVTDGVLEVVNPDEMVDLFWRVRGDTRACAEGIITRAAERKAQDDSTVVVVDVLSLEDDRMVESPCGVISDWV